MWVYAYTRNAGVCVLGRRPALLPRSIRRRRRRRSRWGRSGWAQVRAGYSRRWWSCGGAGGEGEGAEYWSAGRKGSGIGFADIYRDYVSARRAQGSPWCLQYIYIHMCIKNRML